MKVLLLAFMSIVACCCGIVDGPHYDVTITNFNGKRIRVCSPPTIMEPGIDDTENIKDGDVARSWANIALGKTVTASSESFVSDLSVITDGMMEFDVTNAVLLVENGYPHVPWVQIDLGEEKPIYAVRIWHRYEPGFKFCFRDVVVQLFDSDMRIPPKTIFNNDYDNTSGLGRGADRPYVESQYGKLILLLEPATGRYVRVYTADNCWGSNGSWFAEVQVLGPAESNKGPTK